MQAVRSTTWPNWRALAERATDRWAQLSLLMQFVLTSSAILFVGMLVIGHWVTQRISQGVIHTHAVAAALYADNYIEGKLQELATRSSLSPESQQALDAVLQPQATGSPIHGFRIWKGNTIIYSDQRELIGQTFPPSHQRQKALEGQVTVDYGQLAPGHGPAHAVGQFVLEIYAPVHQLGTDNIIALAETYQSAPGLEEELLAARRGSWLLVSCATLLIQLLQIVIVGKGSRIIQRQRSNLSERIGHLSELLAENRMLRQRASEASRRVTEMTELKMRQVGADLHDGPVQLLSAAVLRLDTLNETIASADKVIAAEASEDIAILREVLRDTLEDIRSVSTGLAPPDIQKMSLAAALATAARRHERRTGSTVICNIFDLPREVPDAYKSCLYRFAQEGLSNAVRHAKGNGQTLTACIEGDRVIVEIDDHGPGLGTTDPFSGHGGQGLIGLRDRVLALGGEFGIGRRPGGGTRVTARFEVSQWATEQGPIRD